MPILDTDTEELIALQKMKIREREARENQQAKTAAQQSGKPVTFIAADGCEVTVTPSGDVFYNAADWY